MKSEKVRRGLTIPRRTGRTVTRKDHDYTMLYKGYLENISDDPENTAKWLDENVRVALSTLALLYCIDCNQHHKISCFTEDIRVVLNDNQQYTGCMISCKNSIMFDTVTQSVYFEYRYKGFLPGIIKTSFDAQLGYPHYTGSCFDPEPKMRVIEPDDIEDLNETYTDPHTETSKQDYSDMTADEWINMMAG